MNAVQRLRWLVLVALPVVLALSAIGLAGGQPATPLREGEQEDYGCVSYRTGSNFNRDLYGTCTQSHAWWDSFTCDQTPIQHGPWTPPSEEARVAASPFSYNPWLHLETEHGDVVVMLWFGSRPIPAGDFSEKPRGAAHISLIFPTPVSTVRLTATEPDVKEVLDLPPHANTFVTDGTVWDVDASNPPRAGCWTYTITATTTQDTEIRADYTFVAVE